MELCRIEIWVAVLLPPFLLSISLLRGNGVIGECNFCVRVRVCVFYIWVSLNGWANNKDTKND